MPSKIERLLLVLAICFFLLQRVGLILYGYPHIAHPAFDETASGVLACDFLDGHIRAPLAIYQYESRSGDSLIEGFLLVPFFSLFGRALISLKLLALASAFFSLLCWIALLRRYQGMWASIIFAALFAFPPPMFARLTLFGTVASHHLLNPLIALQLLLLFLILEGGKGRAVPWLWLGMGALAGLGTYTFYTHIIFNLWCVLLLLVFRPQLISATAALLCGGGFLAGFSPWIAMAVSSGGGGGYLLSILGNMGLKGWVLLRNLVYTLPHALGYHYPSPGIKAVSVLFLLFTLFLGGVMASRFLSHLRATRAGSLRMAMQGVSPPFIASIGVLLFPPFFMFCLSISPLEIKPFEYWPNVGFFGHFAVADVYRYRWLTPLFPFWLGIISVGMVSLFTTRRGHALARCTAVAGLAFFLLFGAVKSVSFCSGDQFNRLHAYQGFSYDQMANRFMLRLADTADPQRAGRFIAGYPEANRAEAYKFLGARVMMRIREHGGTEKELDELLRAIPSAHRSDVLYGIIWAAQDIPESFFKPFARCLADTLKGSYYEMWGYRYLSYKYYLVLLNWEKIRACIPPEEQWFFKGFLRSFGENMQGRRGEEQEKKFIREIETIPPEHRPDAVRGIGMRVGAEMLYNPVGAADYPLDSRAGVAFAGALREPFLEGVGRGIADALCRLWRTLLLPEDAASTFYWQALDMEWERCCSLRHSLSLPSAGAVERGFWKGLQEEVSDPRLLGYLQDKRREEGIDG